MLAATLLGGALSCRRETPMPATDSGSIRERLRGHVRRPDGLRELPSGRDAPLEGLAPRPRDAGGDGGDRPRRLRRRARSRTSASPRPSRKRDGKFFVRTDGPDGKLHEYPIAYTFGVYPLQQYLIAVSRRPLPGPERRAGTRARRRRAASAGSTSIRRRAVPHDDPLHWTGPYQNWNFMCAECHSTNVKKGYTRRPRHATRRPGPRSTSRARPATARAPRTWPGPRRSGRRRRRRTDADKGLAVVAQRPRRRRPGSSTRRPASRSAASPRTSRAEVETCARCHARRSVVCRRLRLRPAARCRRTGRRCSTRGSTTPTGRSRTRSTSTARSSRARCTRPA